MAVLISNIQDKVPVDERLEDLVRRTVEAGLAEELSPAARDRAEVSVALVDDDHIHELNRKYRDTDCATDVLSFAMLEGIDGEEGPLLLGDIVVSLERAKQQAEDYGHGFEREVAFLTLHGLFHLLGHDHETSEREAEMNGRQETILAKLGLPR